MRNRIFATIVLLSMALGVYAQTPAFKEDDYKKALWMTTRFYGAQRMGKGCNNWVLWDYKGNNLPSNYLHGDSYIKDADGSYDLTGGWFDCGDFVLFGQTFYYSVYTLLLGYSEFADGYGDYYSQDYKEYTSKGKYTWETSTSGNGIPDILDECKWATDFCLKAYNKEKNLFYYQKGDGNADHQSWITSPTKSTKSKSEGGESDGSRTVLGASGNVTDMAALAGASLALMSRVYKSYDATYASKCLAKAKEIYEFVKSSSKGNTDSPRDNATGNPFYTGKGGYIQDETILYAELYRATSDAKYKTDMETAASQWIENNWDHGWVFCYTKTHDAAAYLLGSIANKYQTAGKNALKNLVQNYKGKASGKRFDNGDYSWGYLRYIADQAFVAGLDAKLNNTSGNDDYVYTTIDYIMGNNSGNFSYIVGFGSKYPEKPHHRNIYRNDDNNMDGVTSINSSYAYSQFGFLVGGANDGTYTDFIKNYNQAEGGIDYNAGLVGALGYINTKFAKTKTVESITITKAPKSTYLIGDKLDVTGGTIKVTYSDATSKTIPMTAAMVSGFKSTAANNSLKLTVTYEGKTTSYTVKVVTVSSVAWNTQPTKTSYFVGDKFDFTSGKITVTYSDNTSVILALNADGVTVTGFDSSKGVSGQTVTVSCGGQKVSFVVKVQKRPASIAFTTNPKTDYIHKDAKDLSVGELTITYDDKTTEKIALSSTKLAITGLSTETIGSDIVVTVKFTANNKTVSTTYNINVKESSIKSISITAPTKKTYQIGEALNVTGGKVKIAYNDGCTKTINMTKDMVSGFSSDLGTSKLTLTVTYGGKTAKFDVAVQKVAKSLTVTTQPKLGYEIGEDFNPDGGLFYVSYNDGTVSSQIDIISDYISGFSSQTAGLFPVKLTYEGVSTNIYVTINKKPVNTVTINQMPDKTEYQIGEELDLSGASIKVFFTDNTSEVVDLTPEMLVKPFAPKTPGDYKVDITYGGKTSMFIVKILKTETPDIPTPVETVTPDNSQIYSYGHTIYLRNVKGRVEVFSTSGVLVFSGFDEDEISISTPGIYIVKAGALSQKVLIQR